MADHVLSGEWFFGDREQALTRSLIDMKQKSETDQVEVGGAGIGEISDDMIARRARELAVADGRAQANAKDLQDARDELASGSARVGEDLLDSIAEEDRPGNGVPSTTHGGQTNRLELEDENNLAAEEVEEGVAEADHDTRVRSTKGG